LTQFIRYEENISFWTKMLFFDRILKLIL